MINPEEIILDDFPFDIDTTLVEEITRKRIENSSTVEETADAISDALVFTIIRQIHL
jgi:hypothetical protein